MKKNRSVGRSMKAGNYPKILSGVFATLLAFSQTGVAQTWDGGSGVDGNWNTAANWVGDVAPAANASLTFDQALRLAAANNFTAATQFNGITFATSAGAFALSGNSITLGGNIIDNSLNALSSSIPLVLNADRSVNVASNMGALTLSGVISGPTFTLTKSGAGLLTLSGGTNTFTNLNITGGTVSVAGDGNLGSTTGTITLNGGALRSTVTINAARSILLGNAGAGTGGAIDAAGNITYGGVLANNGGTNSFTKTGTGTLDLGGTNTYTGNTIINQGLLRLDLNANPNASINSSSTLVMGGIPTTLGTVNASLPGFFVQGKILVAATQTFNGLTLNPGAVQIASRAISTNATTVALGAITHNAGSSVAFTRDGYGGANTGLISTSTANDSSGILGGWAVINSSNPNSTAFQSPTDYATNDGTGNIIAYTGYSVQAAGALNTGTTLNVRATSALSITTTNGGTDDINTFSQATAGTSTITVGTAGTGSTGILRLGANGGLFAAAGGGGMTIGNVANNGTLTAGGAANTAGEINIIDATANGVTINSKIADNGTGAVSLTFSDYVGNSNYTLNGTNTYTGGSTITSGRVVGATAAAFGTGAVTVLAGGQAFLSGTAATYANDFNIIGQAGINTTDTPGAIRFNGGQTISGKVTLLGDSTLALRNSTGNAITGQITGGYNLTIAGSGAAGGNITLSNTNNNYTGNLNITQERVILGAANVLSNGAGIGNVVLSNDATSILDLNGNSETINGLASVGANGFVQNGVTGTPLGAILRVGDGDATATFSGIIRNNGGGTGVLSLNKIGLGTQVLAGANTYTGATVVSNGTLLVNGSLASGSAVSVASGANLGGSGTVAGTVTTADVGSVIAPGNGSGTLTLGALDTTAGATLVFELGTSSDVLAVTGLLTGSSAAGGLQFNFANSGGLLTGNPYTIMTFGSVSGLNYSDFLANILPSGFFLDSSFGTGGYLINANSLQVQFSTVPEPSTYALLGTGLLSLWAMRRKRSA